MLMNRAMAIYIGIIVTVVASSIGLVFIPRAQLAGLEPYRPDGGEEYPVPLYGDALYGRAHYISLGCIYCHSQQVRPEGFGADIDRGWGTRRSVARDFMYDEPHLLGTMRTGPDLANVGLRLPSATWHYQHLYDPQITSEGSIMPPFRFLFEKRQLKPGELPPDEAVPLPEGWLGADEYILPTRQGRELVAYLLSLRHQAPLPEAP